MNSNATVQFSLGQVVITRSALEVLPNDEVMLALSRHAKCDWGDVSAEDGKENELSLKEGFRLFSVYHTTAKVKFWIITEADRSSTTILLPDDY